MQRCSNFLKYDDSKCRRLPRFAATQSQSGDDFTSISHIEPLTSTSIFGGATTGYIQLGSHETIKPFSERNKDVCIVKLSSNDVTNPFTSYADTEFEDTVNSNLREDSLIRIHIVTKN